MIYIQDDLGELHWIFPTDATIKSEINGAWSASMRVPLDTLGEWDLIKPEAVVGMPSWLPGVQHFRIKRVRKTMDSFQCDMVPVFYDCAEEVFCVSKESLTTPAGPAAIFNGIVSDAGLSSKYSIITSGTIPAKTYSYKDVNLLQVICGDADEGIENEPFIHRWGLEAIFSNYSVQLSSRYGVDNNFEIRYGKNLLGMNYTEDTSDVVTRIYPRGYNGKFQTASYYVDSPLAGNYPFIKSRAITYENIMMEEDASEEDLADENVTVCSTLAQLQTALTAAANAEFTAGIDKPKVSITIDGFAQNVEGFYPTSFQGSSLPYTPQLGDTVWIINELLDIMTEARVMSVTYDAVREEIKSMVIDSVPYNYFKDVSRTINKVLR